MSAWIKKKEQWLPQTIRQKETPVIKQVEEIPAQKEPEEYGVIFYPLRCPRCKSKEIKTHTSSPPVRYHKCKECGFNFKSMEKED